MIRTSTTTVLGGVAQDQFGAEHDVGRMPFRAGDLGEQFALSLMSALLPYSCAGIRGGNAAVTIGRGRKRVQAQLMTAVPACAKPTMDRKITYSPHPLRRGHERAA